MKQEYKQKQKTRTEETYIDETSTDVSNEDLGQATEGTLDKIDDVLDDQEEEDLLADMDSVLEENAERFVEEYVQAGGE